MANWNRDPGVSGEKDRGGKLKREGTGGAGRGLGVGGGRIVCRFG